MPGIGHGSGFPEKAGKKKYFFEDGTDGAILRLNGSRDPIRSLTPGADFAIAEGRRGVPGPMPASLFLQSNLPEPFIEVFPGGGIRISLWM